MSHAAAQLETTLFVRTKTIAAIVFACVASGCAMEGRQPRASIESVDQGPRVRPVDAISPVPWMAAATESSAPVSERIAAFAHTLSESLGEKGRRVAVLPAVAYDVRRGRPWVPELGVRLGEVIRSEIAARSQESRVLTDGEVVDRLAASNLEKRMFVSHDLAMRLAPGLDVDVVVFCSLRVEYDIGRSGRSVITVESIAFDAIDGRGIAKMRCEVGDELSGNAAFFELAKRESTWLIANG